MKTLIVYAHPDHESHAKATLERVKDKLQEKNIEYEVLDLYHMKFDPVLSRSDLYDSKEKGVSHDVAELQKKITHSNHLIFIYPIWWNGMPAILKGFLDRVFTPGFAYKFVNKIPQGLLKDKKVTVFTTTGSSKFMTQIFLGNRFVKNATRDIFGFCGMKAKVYHVDKAYELNDTQREKIRKNVEKALG
jgi:NAD(P)H dehydrogenase (quinone)